MKTNTNKLTVRILITGGTGFFGKSLLRYLQSANISNQSLTVCVMSRDPVNFIKKHSEFDSLPWLSFYHGDILRPSSFPKDSCFTHIIHAATDSTLGLTLSPMDRYIQIVEGTRNMLDFAVENNIKRFLLTSSGGVYGPQPSDMEQMSEIYCGMPDPLIRDNTYSVSKRCAEHLCALYQDHHGLETVIARCFSFVGRDLPLDVHFAIGNFIRDALTKDEISLQGDGTSIRSYMDQRDLAIWLYKLLMSGRSGQAYNVGSDQAISIKDLARLVRDTLSPQKPVRIYGQLQTQNFRNRYVPSIQKAKTELNLGLNFSLNESIREAALHAYSN